MKRLFIFFISALMALQIMAQVERQVIIEHFTNTRCGVCASQNPAFYQVLNDYPDVLHISYHPSSPYPDCKLNLHNPQENDNRAYFYGVYGATPRAVLQGEVMPFQSPLVKPEQIDAQIGESSDYKVTMAKTELSGNNNKITLEIERVSGSEYETILMYAGLAEKELNYDAPNGETLHHDVFRKVIFFDTVNFSSSARTRIIDYDYTTNSEWDEDQIYAFAILHNYTTNKVIQSGNSLESASGLINKKITELSSILFPNPSSGILNIKNEYSNKFKRIEFYDLLGNKMKEFGESNTFNISELPEGFYFVRLTDFQEDIYSTRIIKTTY